METFSKQQFTPVLTRVCRTMVPYLLMEHRKESWKKGQRGRFKEARRWQEGDELEEGGKVSQQAWRRIPPRIPASSQRAPELTAPTAPPKNTCVGV